MAAFFTMAASEAKIPPNHMRTCGTNAKNGSRGGGMLDCDRCSVLGFPMLSALSLSLLLSFSSRNDAADPADDDDEPDVDMGGVGSVPLDDILIEAVDVVVAAAALK